MPSTLRLGVLGAARINRRVLPAAKAAHNVTLVALAASTRAKAEAAAASYGVPVALEGYEALLARDDIDAVYLPLANHLHAEWCLKAARAGKHVLCEKPLALSAVEVARLEDAAASYGVTIMEAFMYRFHPQHERVRSRIAAGDIGAVTMLRGSFAFVLSQEGYNIRLDPAAGGGATWDVGCYGVNAARWFLGEPAAVYAEANFVRGVDLSAAAILDFDGDKRAVLDYGLGYGRRCTYEVIGTKGSLAVETVWQEPDVPARILWRGEAGGFAVEELPPQNHFQLQLEAFAGAVLEGRPAPYPLSDSRQNVAVCEALVRSMRSGARVFLDEPHHHG